jgi:hypothetical protein
MPDRSVDAFFYGLFMDVEILRENQVTPVNPRPASVEGFVLRIGKRATLLPSPGGRAFGMLISLTHRELGRLYSGTGLEQYRPEAVLARVDDVEAWYRDFMAHVVRRSEAPNNDLGFLNDFPAVCSRRSFDGPGA